MLLLLAGRPNCGAMVRARGKLTVEGADLLALLDLRALPDAVVNGDRVHRDAFAGGAAVESAHRQPTTTAGT